MQDDKPLIVILFSSSIVLAGVLGAAQLAPSAPPRLAHAPDASPRAPLALSSATAQDEDDHEHSHHSIDGSRRDALNNAMKSLEAHGQLKPFAHLSWVPRLKPEDLPTPLDAPVDPQDIYEQVADATVLFHTAYKCQRCTQWHGGIATGFVVHPDGWIVTAAHVVDDLDENRVAAVMLRDGRTLPVTGVGLLDSPRDTALVKVDAHALPAVPLATQNPRPGTPVFAISHPQNHFFYMTQGIVSRVLGEHEPVPSRLQVTAGYATGSSGGPIVDSHGNVVGMVIATRTLYADRREQKSPQLVIRSCVPVEDIHRAIFALPESAAAANTSAAPASPAQK